MMTREEKRLYLRQWRAAHPDKVKAAALRYRTEQHDKVLGAKLRYRQRHPDRIKAYNDAHRRDRYLATRRWLAKHPERRRVVRRVAVGEVLRVGLGRNSLYAAANAAVARGLPRDVREDVIQSIIVAVLEGELAEAAIAGAARHYVTRHYAGQPRAYSLDDFIPGTKVRYIDSLVAAE